MQTHITLPSGARWRGCEEGKEEGGCGSWRVGRSEGGGKAVCGMGAAVTGLGGRRAWDESGTLGERGFDFLRS